MSPRMMRQIEFDQFEAEYHAQPVEHLGTVADKEPESPAYVWLALIGGLLLAAATYCGIAAVAEAWR